MRLYIDGDFIRKESFAPYEWGVGNNDPELQNLSIGQHELTAVAFDNTGDRKQESIFINVTTSGLAHLIRETNNNSSTATALPQELGVAANQENETDASEEESIENRSIEIEEVANLQFDIFPNPTSQQLSIQWKTNLEEGMSLRLYNALGQVVHLQDVQATTVNGVKWNVESLASGIYLLEIHSDKDLLRSEKVVISREN